MLDGPTLLPRLAMRWYHSAGAITGGLAFGIGVSVLVLTLSGVSLGDIWNEFVVFTFLDSAGLAPVAVAATPLIIVGLAASIALKLNFWNIGVEGMTNGRGWIAIAIVIFAR